ncbi:MAG TPA: tRNA (guanosine(46)-N7)-methyltransferase TrmB [Bacteroidia bacterium]|nr:tRNA (guanosine(46)-N7)-methyltransferase TrmB [Bacteroidia bacterium]
MGKDKLRRFAELETFKRVFQPGNFYAGNEFDLKGCWGEKVFENHRPIVLELGCGRGEYTVNLAKKFPDNNYIGIDKKGARLWRGAKTINEENILNAAFMRIQITQLSAFFAPEEINEIWITFPDPQPQSTRENTRLTSHRFLEMYKTILKPNGILHLKTDNVGLFDYTVEILQGYKIKIHHLTRDLYNSDIADDILSIKTTYEQRYLSQGINICYLSFSFQ